MLITFKSDVQEIDCKVESEQKIIDVLKVLVDNQQLLLDIEKLQYIYSHRNTEKINAQMRFIDVNIYHGDVLEMERIGKWS